MNRYKKTFYFKNGATLTSEYEGDKTIDYLNDYYYKRKKKGSIVTEMVDNIERMIVDLKDVCLIDIEEIKEGE